MNHVLADGRGRWIVAAGAAVVVVASFLLLVRVPAPVILPATNSPSESAPPSSVKLARADGADVLLRQEAQLRDLRPLFLPTDVNAALPEPHLEPGRSFLDNDNLKLRPVDVEVPVAAQLPAVVTLDGVALAEARPRDALVGDAARIELLGIGRQTVVAAPLPSRGGWLEVSAAGDGERVIAEALPLTAKPPSEKPWYPLELVAVIDAAGLVGPLVVTEGSRVEDVDAHFKNFLAERFRIGERLAPGFYRISVVP